MAHAHAKRPFLLLPWPTVIGLLAAAAAVTQLAELDLKRRAAVVREERRLLEEKDAARRAALPTGRPLDRNPDTIEGRLHKIIASKAGEDTAARVTTKSFLFVSRSFFHRQSQEEADYDLGLSTADQDQLFVAIEIEFGDIPETDLPTFNSVEGIIAVLERRAAESKEKEKSHWRCMDCGTWVMKPSTACPTCALLKENDDD